MAFRNRDRLANLCNAIGSTTPVARSSPSSRSPPSQFLSPRPLESNS